jgi:hypothetical protein
MERAAGPDAAEGQQCTGGRLRGDPGILDELRFHWGSAYRIGTSGGVYTARRRDGKGSTLTDPLPEGLRLKIVADYRADPVPRDLP